MVTEGVGGGQSERPSAAREYTPRVTLLETVPNLSEGRDQKVIDSVTEALASAVGVRVLDVSSDPDHNRSVISAVGEAACLEAGLLRMYETALAGVDLSLHSGAHPRVGAVDVVPFVPIEGSSMASAVAAARSLGRRVAQELDIPVFLYGEATECGEPRRPVSVRRGGVEALAGRLAAGRIRPDFGPVELDRRRGATLVGARGPMVAFNVTLSVSGSEPAQTIARAIRERDGGMPGVQALGLAFSRRRGAQVSVNLFEAAGTTLYSVLTRIQEEALAVGVEVRESEIVGLVPEAALLGATAQALQLPQLRRRQVLESYLERSPLPAAAAGPRSFPKTS